MWPFKRKPKEIMPVPSMEIWQLDMAIGAKTQEAIESNPPLMRTVLQGQNPSWLMFCYDEIRTAILQLSQDDDGVPTFSRFAGSPLTQTNLGTGTG